MDHKYRLPLWAIILLISLLFGIILFSAITKNDKSIKKDAAGTRFDGYKEDLGDLFVSEGGLIAKGEKEVTFILDANISHAPIDLYMDDKLIGPMIETGAEDFTCHNVSVYRITEMIMGGEDKQEHTFVAVSEGRKSRSVSLYAFDEVTDKDKEMASLYLKEFEIELKDCFDEEGFIKPDKKSEAMRIIQKKITLLKAKGVIMKYVLDSTVVTFQFDSGLWATYEPLTKEEYEKRHPEKIKN